jgi:hypothetical protein
MIPRQCFYAILAYLSAFIVGWLWIANEVLFIPLNIVTVVWCLINYVKEWDK